MESVDYLSLCTNGKNPKGGRPSTEYRISTSCREYFQSENHKYDFMYSIDYEPLVFLKSKNSGSGGHNKIDYRISTRCLEFLIARKVREVRTMKRQFIEGVDYEPLIEAISKKEGSGGQNRVDYRISVSCLEY